jgi:hypothetical protein
MYSSGERKYSIDEIQLARGTRERLPTAPAKLIAYILKHYFFAETTGLQQKV